jgi:hypothetical protein
MNLQALARNFRLYLRAASLVAEIRLRLQLRKTVLTVLALALAIAGLAMIDLAAFRALETAWGPLWTPLALGLANLALAAALGLAILALKPGRELSAAADLRQMAYNAMEADLKSVQDGSGLLTGLLGGSTELQTARLLIPVISTIIGALRHRRKPESK